MKLQELKSLIREEVRKVIKEAEIPAEAQAFAAAAKKKYQANLLGVDFIEPKPGHTVVTAYINIDKWDLPDKYWANKYTKTLGNSAFLFRTEPVGSRTFSLSNMRGTEVPVK